MKSVAVGVASLFAALAAPVTAGMNLSSDDLQPGATISSAQIYPRCGGDNISPQLSWSGVPAGTKSLAITMIDSSVKPSQWSHWVVVDIPPNTVSLARATKALPGAARAIKTNFGDASYDGPCPPNGSGTHQYQITIWALSTSTVSIPSDMKATDLTRSLAKVALDHASLTGILQR